MSKLLKCPFCGRRAELRYDKDGFSYIVCANDGCYVRTDGHLNEESAINHWNTRKPMANIVEKLEEKQERYDDVAFMEMNTNGHTLDFEYAHGKKDGVQEAINIVKQEINNGLE